MRLCSAQPGGDDVSDLDGLGGALEAAGASSKDEHMASVSTHLSSSPGVSD